MILGSFFVNTCVHLGSESFLILSLTFLQVRVPHPTPPPDPCGALVTGSAQRGDLVGACVRVAWNLGQDLRTAKGQADSELARVVRVVPGMFHTALHARILSLSLSLSLCACV